MTEPSDIKAILNELKSLKGFLQTTLRSHLSQSFARLADKLSDAFLNLTTRVNTVHQVVIGVRTDTELIDTKISQIRPYLDPRFSAMADALATISDRLTTIEDKIDALQTTVDSLTIPAPSEQP